MKLIVLLFSLLFSITSLAGTVTVTGKPTQIEVTERLFFKIENSVNSNPNNCSANYQYEFTMDDGTSGTNKELALTMLITAYTMQKNLVFKVHDSMCSDLNRPAVVSVSFG